MQKLQFVNCHCVIKRQNKLPKNQNRKPITHCMCKNSKTNESEGTFLLEHLKTKTLTSKLRKWKTVTSFLTFTLNVFMVFISIHPVNNTEIIY